ncbi:MAG: hypothetical protein COB38_03865 [Gammaproteobacteria bacterium]|nr:MAG: hypothetical protein COB38_03865 [Gammaproteobacteria bacterium]
MQYTTIGLGTLIVIFSIYTLYLSLTASDKQIRLVYMKSKLGSFGGSFLHALVYVIIPIVFASFMINAGLNGETITEFISE